MTRSPRAEIPYGAYWTTPFARWQGSFASLHSVRFAAHVTRAELAKRNIDGAVFDLGVLGMTIPQHHSFYGVPWFTGMAGMPSLTGPTVSQACATGVRCVAAAVQAIESGDASAVLTVTCDRNSNGPHLYYPNPRGPGGTGGHEDWVLDNFSCDPLGEHAMVRTAENVAAKHRITAAEQHEVVLWREEQYQAALAEGAAFHRRFMTLPFSVPSPDFRKTVATLEGDEGVNRSTPEGLAKLKPVLAEGTVTFGSQTHPADANGGIVIVSPEKAPELSQDRKVRVRILGFGQARAELAYMPEAPVPAARKALAEAGLEFKDLDAVKTHNPFTVNDIVFARETGFDWRKMNNYGSTLVWGHPNAPMGTRGIIELIEELAARGGGRGLFSGCAAGDSAMAIAIEVGE
jgi:acetyl-CoA acetyltransferase